MITETNFKLKHRADIDGTSLQCYLPGLSDSALEAAFGPGMPDVFDEEKGYGGPTWTFIGPNGHVYNVYSRWDEYRIGARDGADVNAFKAWLLGELSSPGLN